MLFPSRRWPCRLPGVQGLRDCGPQLGAACPGQRLPVPEGQQVSLLCRPLRRDLEWSRVIARQSYSGRAGTSTHLPLSLEV